jgi:hypothetical protein
MGQYAGQGIGRAVAVELSGWPDLEKWDGRERKIAADVEEPQAVRPEHLEMPGAAAPPISAPDPDEVERWDVARAGRPAGALASAMTGIVVEEPGDHPESCQGAARRRVDAVVDQPVDAVLPGRAAARRGWGTPDGVVARALVAWARAGRKEPGRAEEVHWGPWELVVQPGERAVEVQVNLVRGRRAARTQQVPRLRPGLEPP